MFRKFLSFFLVTCLVLTTSGPFDGIAQAQEFSGKLILPPPGVLINLSPAYQPVIIKGLTIRKDNPFLFDFIVDAGQDRMSVGALKEEGCKLIKYFLASLTIPDKDVWVNLSPYEKDKMVPEALGQTDMGRDLLEQDYILKQITASLIYPERKLGRTFWDKVYREAREKYGTTQIPVNTFNKVWILADRAEVYEHNQTAFVVDSHLKVMLEEDYLALTKHAHIMSSPKLNPVTPNIASSIIRQIILPELEKEVNTGKNFANLRQILNSLILANWYKKNLKQSLLNQVYSNQSKIKGIDLNDPTVKERIYEQYLKAYKKGVFNYIKAEVTAQGESIPRRYFSGGFGQSPAVIDPAQTTDPNALKRGLTDDAMVAFEAVLDANQPVLPADKDKAMQAESPDNLVSVLYNKVNKTGNMVDWSDINSVRKKKIRGQIRGAVDVLYEMIDFNSHQGRLNVPDKRKILNSIVDTSVFHPKIFDRTAIGKFGVGEDIPPTFVFDGNIFQTYPQKVKPYRIALTIGKDFTAITATYSDLIDYKDFTIWREKGFVSGNFDPARFLLAKGGLRLYQQGKSLDYSFEQKYKGISGTLKPVLLEAVDLARGMGDKNAPATVFFEGGKSIFLLNEKADYKKVTRQWVTSSMLAGVLGRLYDAGPDMNNPSDMMGILQDQANLVQAVLGLPQVKVTTSIKDEPASFDHVKWTVTSISAFESYMVAYNNPWIRKRYHISDKVDIVIQGFGDVGSGLVAYINEHYSDWIKDGRIRIVAVSDKNGGIYDPQGLDINELLHLRGKSQSVREDYKNQVRRKVYTWEGHGEEVFYVRSKFPVDAEDSERSVIAFPAAGPNVFNSAADIERLKGSGVRMVVSPANSPLNETAKLELEFEKGDNRLLYLGPEVGFGGIYTSMEEMFHNLYEGGTSRLREKMTGTGADEWKAHIQDGIVNLTMSLISIELKQFESEIKRGHSTTFHDVHEEIAAHIRLQKDNILKNPTLPLMNYIRKEIDSVVREYEIANIVLTPEYRDEIALIVILYRVVDEARLQSLYERSGREQLDILERMLSEKPANAGRVEQTAIYELGKMANIAAREGLLQILSNPQFSEEIRSTAAAALYKIGKEQDIKLLDRVASESNSPSLRFSANWAKQRIASRTANAAMIAEKTVSLPVIEPNLKGGIDLSSFSGMRWKISKIGDGVKMDVDAAMIKRIRQEGINNLSVEILKVSPITNIWSFMGLASRMN